MPPSQWNGTGKGYPQAANAKIAAYLCPSDAGKSAPVVVDGWWFNAGPQLGYQIWGDWVCNIPGYGADLGRTNHVGVGGGYGLVQPGDAIHAAWRPYTGIYCANSRTRVTDIKDGTQYTLAFGEALGGLHCDGTREYELSWMGASRSFQWCRAAGSCRVWSAFRWASTSGANGTDAAGRMACTRRPEARDGKRLPSETPLHSREHRWTLHPPVRRHEACVDLPKFLARNCHSVH